jgi:hypothetical protein
MRQNPELLMRGRRLDNAARNWIPNFVRILRFDCRRSARKFSIASGVMSDNAVSPNAGLSDLRALTFT